MSNKRARPILSTLWTISVQTKVIWNVTCNLISMHCIMLRWEKKSETISVYKLCSNILSDYYWWPVNDLTKQLFVITTPWLPCIFVFLYEIITTALWDSLVGFQAPWFSNWSHNIYYISNNDKSVTFIIVLIKKKLRKLWKVSIKYVTLWQNIGHSWSQ